MNKNAKDATLATYYFVGLILIGTQNIAIAFGIFLVSISIMFA